MQISEDTSVFDIETKTFGKLNALKDLLKLFGCYSYKTNKYYMLKDKETIQKVINNHKYFVGFNIKNYDIPVCERFSLNFKYKFIIDLWDIIDKRKTIIKIKEGILSDLLIHESLDFISKILGLMGGEGKLEMDFKIIGKDNWTNEEEQLINDYCKRDVELTKRLYEWLEEFFEPFKEFVTKKDVTNKSYLTCKPPTLTYKALCKELNLPEEYNDVNYEVEEERIKGGYVSYPAGESFSGNIYCLDFNSMYPHNFMQCNLFGRKKDNEQDNRPVYNGNGVWKLDGTYYSDELSTIGKVIQKWFKQRKEYKQNKDRREYALKILLNILYGISDNISYKHTYDNIAAGDCTGFGRQIIKYARKIFREKGYKVIYTDTDSIYLVDLFNDKEKLMAVKKEIIDYIKSTVPFPQDTFDMGIDAEIKYMFFFKGGNKDKEEDDDMDEDDFINKHLGYMKKNYIYVTKDDKVVVKNLGIRKKSTSLLTRKLFWENIVPEMIKNGNCKFNKTWISNIINRMLEEDLTLAGIRYVVGNLDDYSKSMGSIYAQISKKYGSGIHFLIPNTRNIGVGKGKSYCTIEEFKQSNLKIKDIDLSNIWNELDYFIKPIETKNIFDY